MGLGDVDTVVYILNLSQASFLISFFFFIDTEFVPPLSTFPLALHHLTSAMAGRIRWVGLSLRSP